MEEKEVIKPIDFTRIAKQLWPYRRKYCYVMSATLILTYLLTLCAPRYYRCQVSLAPEVDGMNVSGSLGSLAASFGLGSTLGKMTSQDAISSDIYPDVIQSKNFIAELMTVDVETKDGSVKCNYYTYMRDKRGYDALDEYVREEVLQLTGAEYDALERLVGECASRIYNALWRQNFEPGTKTAFDGYVACLHQMYLAGVAMQLRRMGYRMVKME